MSDEMQEERLTQAGIVLTPAELKLYLTRPDILPSSTTTIPKGYKRCTKCKNIKKIYLFNKNTQAKDGCTCQCKECQKSNAHKSYAANKHKRNYKKYYQEHKEAKQQQSREYYQEHKDDLKVKHAQYRNTSKGRKAMNKSHAKRARLLKTNTGIPYTREIVIDRDKQGGTDPICYLCGKPITGTQIHLDHVVPVVMGGKDCFTNIACVHDLCNLSKSKDGREITTEQVEHINALSEAYMEEHQDLFPEIFGESSSDETDTDADEANE